MVLNKDRGSPRNPSPLNLSTPRRMRVVPGCLKITSSGVLGVNSTVPLDKSLHRPRLEIEHTSGLPNRTLTDVTSYRSLRVGSPERYEETHRNGEPLTVWICSSRQKGHPTPVRLDSRGDSWSKKTPGSERHERTSYRNLRVSPTKDSRK